MSASAEPRTLTDSTRLQRWFLLLLALLITIGFYRVIEPFIISVLMAAIFAGMTHPFYLWLVKKTKGREVTSAVLTILAIVILLIGPAIFFVGLLANEALNVSESVGPWIQAQAENPGAIEVRLDDWARNLPMVGDLIPEREVVLRKLGEIAGLIGGFLVNGLASATRGTVNFIF